MSSSIFLQHWNSLLGIGLVFSWHCNWTLISFWTAVTLHRQPLILWLSLAGRFLSVSSPSYLYTGLACDSDCCYEDWEYMRGLTHEAQLIFVQWKMTGHKTSDWIEQEQGFCKTCGEGWSPILHFTTQILSPKVCLWLTFFFSSLSPPSPTFFLLFPSPLLLSLQIPVSSCTDIMFENWDFR